VSRVLRLYADEWRRVGDVAPVPPVLHDRLPRPEGQPLIRRRLHAQCEVLELGRAMLADHMLDGVERPGG